MEEEEVGEELKSLDVCMVQTGGEICRKMMKIWRILAVKFNFGNLNGNPTSGKFKLLLIFGIQIELNLDLDHFRAEIEDLLF